MATLIFQSYQGVSQDEEGKLKLDHMILEQLERLATSSRYWTIFRVGKQATRQVFKSLLYGWSVKNSFSDSSYCPKILK